MSDRLDEALVLCCWHCKEPMDERDAVVVRANPHMPEWMSKSTTKVHQACVDDHLEGVND